MTKYKFEKWEELPDDLKAGWIAGFIEGEGSFTSKKARKRRYPVFNIAQKDKTPLEAVRNFFGFGTIYYRPKERASYRWVVRKKSELEELRDFFLKYGFRSEKKRHQFEQWLTFFTSFVGFTPEVIKRRNKAIRKAHSRPEVKRKDSEASKRMWSNPEIRARFVEVAKKRYQNPDHPLRRYLREKRKVS